MAKNVTEKNGSHEAGEKKVVTKYDRKVQKKKEEALKAQKRKKITIFTAAALAVVIIAGAVTAVWFTYDRVHHEYITVDNDSVSEIEFDFYYALTKQGILNQSLYGSMTYAQYFQSYMGYDTGKSDKSQEYTGSEGNTWYDYFANVTVSTIKEYKALLNLAAESSFNYTDADADYKTFTDDIAAAAEEEGMTVKEYYKEAFGGHASESGLKEYIYEYLKATAYQEQLRTELAATDDEIKAYYDENKDDFDTVDYRVLEVTARTEGDEESMAEAKGRAEEMLSRVTDEDSFVALCPDYATDEEAEKYNEEGESLQTLISKSSLDSQLAEWLFDAERTSGDKTVIENQDDSAYYVLYFLNRAYNSDNDENIAAIVLSNKYSEKMTPYVNEMAVGNIKNRIKMLEQ